MHTELERLDHGLLTARHPSWILYLRKLESSAHTQAAFSLYPWILHLRELERSALTQEERGGIVRELERRLHSDLDRGRIVSYHLNWIELIKIIMLHCFNKPSPNGSGNIQKFLK